MGVLLAFEDGAQGRRDVGGGKPAGGDLIEQRLEKMKIPPVDERNRDGHMFETLGCVKPTKSAAKYDNPMGFCYGNHGHSIRYERILSTVSPAIAGYVTRM